MKTKKAHVGDDYNDLCVDGITIPTTGRPYNATNVSTLVQSISTIGLQNPIIVGGRVEDGGAIYELRLISGRHRLEAYRILGRQLIPARIDDTDERLWTIAENLHRTELSVVERLSTLLSGYS